MLQYSKLYANAWRSCTRSAQVYDFNMEIYLLRHGIAVERGTRGFEDDFSRPLTPKGRRQLRKTAAVVKKLASKFDLILSSPLVRARQTAEIVAKELKCQKRLRFSNALAPGGGASILIRQLTREKGHPGKVLLVGHEPEMSRLISLLATGGAQLQMDLKKGGLCKLEVEALRDGQCATLVWLLTPKQMKMIA
jgi:phosphohistidine phosphatase